MLDGMSAIEHLIRARPNDIGDFQVLRALPSAARRQVGPFVFVDHFGPVQLPPGRGMDVRPHPHIGLATVTYLFDGEIVHRDSLGSVQAIRPGDVNWMTAGRGIVHSERSPASERVRGARLHGMQIWVGLPSAHEDAAPTFTHYAAASMPRVAFEHANAHVLIGTAFGVASPVATFSPTLYCALDLDAGARVPLIADAPERAIYIARGQMSVDGTAVGVGDTAVFARDAQVELRAGASARAMLFGGEPLDGEGGHRFMWWNFVSSRRERIEAAKGDWAAQRMGQVPGETEFIPMP